MEKAKDTLNIDVDHIDGLEAIFQFLDILSKRASQFRMVDNETGEIKMAAYLLKTFKGFYIYLIDDTDRQSKYLAIYDNGLNHPSAKTLAVGYKLCKEWMDKLEIEETEEESGMMNQLMSINMLLFSYYPVMFIPMGEKKDDITIH